MKENNVNEVENSSTDQQNDVAVTHEVPDDLIADEMLLGMYQEVMEDLREDRKDASDLFATLMDMVLNEGDATTASKEAMVNTLKLRTDIADKKSKIADLATRVKLKEKNTIPLWLADKLNKEKEPVDDNQNKKVRKRELISAINKAQKKEIP